jgi:hypothetical protein
MQSSSMLKQVVHIVTTRLRGVNCKAKAKVKLFLCFIKYAQRHEDVCGSAGIAPPSRPCRFTSGKRIPGTHWIESCVSPSARLDDVEKSLLDLPGWNPARLAPSYTD